MANITTQINKFSGETPPAPTNLNSRGVTRGAYRGFGEVYDVEIPEGTIVEGDNTVTISVVSGNSGEEFLSPNFVSTCVAFTLWDEADCVHRFLIVWSCFSEFSFTHVCMYEMVS